MRVASWGSGGKAAVVRELLADGKSILLERPCIRAGGRAIVHNSIPKLCFRATRPGSGLAFKTALGSMPVYLLRA